jgi:hypothetical protein
MDLGAAGWGLQTVGGGLLLAAVLLWAVLRNRSSRREVERSEQGTSDVYDRSEEVRRSGDDDA